MPIVRAAIAAYRAVLALHVARRSPAIAFPFLLLAFHGTPVSAQSVTLGWDANREPDIVGYTVFYGTRSGVYTGSRAVGNVTRWTATDLKAGQTYYFAVRAKNADGLFSAFSKEVSAVAGVDAWVPASPRLEVDGDGLSDVAVFRPSTGIWYLLKSSTDYAAPASHRWGTNEQDDTPVVGDFDGDGRLDPAFFRRSSRTWFILKSGSAYATSDAFVWGQAADMPVPGDYDGDGTTDAAMYRPSSGTWLVKPSSGGPEWSVVFGNSTDWPVAGDFDGDGKRDPAVYRPSTGTWFWLKSSTSLSTYDMRGWGVNAQGDRPVPGDYDGDGKTDLCVFRPGTGTWFILDSSTDYSVWRYIGWGSTGDIVAPADYDGDGKTDAAIFRPSTGVWHIRPSSGAAQWSVALGSQGDVPLVVR